MDRIEIGGNVAMTMNVKYLRAWRCSEPTCGLVHLELIGEDDEKYGVALIEPADARVFADQIHALAEESERAAKGESVQ